MGLLTRALFYTRIFVSYHLIYPEAKMYRMYIILNSNYQCERPREVRDRVFQPGDIAVSLRGRAFCCVYPGARRSKGEKFSSLNKMRLSSGGVRLQGPVSSDSSSPFVCPCVRAGGCTYETRKRERLRILIVHSSCMFALAETTRFPFHVMHSPCMLAYQ